MTWGCLLGEMSAAAAATITIDFGGDFRTVGSRMNHRASLHEKHGVCVVWVDDMPWMQFDSEDIAARRLAMAQLLGLRVATTPEIASAFGVGTATVERAAKAYREHGVRGLEPKKMPGRAPSVREPAMHKAILALARAGESQRAIALRFGLSRSAVKTSLDKSGWAPEKKQLRLAATNTGSDEKTKSRKEQDRAEACENAPSEAPSIDEEVTLPAETTADPDASDRSLDRLLAREGMLNDAAPLFENADNVRDVGALLAIPVLTQQGCSPWRCGCCRP